MADISIIDTIGKTPLVRVNNVLTPEAKANDVRVLVKLEMQNPGKSAFVLFCLALYVFNMKSC